MFMFREFRGNIETTPVSGWLRRGWWQSGTFPRGALTLAIVHGAQSTRPAGVLSPEECYFPMPTHSQYVDQQQYSMLVLTQRFRWEAC